MVISVSLLKNNQRLPSCQTDLISGNNQRAHMAGMDAGLERRNTMLATAWKCRISVWLVAITEASSGDPISRFAAPHVGGQLGPFRFSSRESCPVGLPCSPRFSSPPLQEASRAPLDSLACGLQQEPGPQASAAAPPTELTGFVLSCPLSPLDET